MRKVLGFVIAFVVMTLIVGAAFKGWLGSSIEAFTWETWGRANEAADKWYGWVDKFGKLAGFFITVGSGAYAIYQKLYFAEFNMHTRLKEFQGRVEDRLKDSHKTIGKALIRPSPAREFEAPIFTDETLNPVLREMNWGKRPKADESLQKTLDDLEKQLGLWDGQKKEYELRKIQALLLKGAIAAARAAQSKGGNARTDNLEALGYFQEAFALSKNTDVDALEYIGHQQVRLGDFPLALQSFEELANMWPGDGPSLPRARALKFQAEVLECRPQPNRQRANGVMLQAVDSLPPDARLLEKAEIHELHGRIRETAGIGRATYSYTEAERLFQRIMDLKGSDEDDAPPARAGLTRVRDALQRIRLQPLNGDGVVAVVLPSQEDQVGKS